MNALDSADKVTYDIETNGLNVRKVAIIGFGIATSPSTSFYVPIHEFRSGELQEYRNKIDYSMIRKILEKLKSKKIICHNAWFDLETTRNYFGVDLVPALYCDTVLLKHTVAEERPFGLKPIAKMLFGAHIADEQKDMADSVKVNGGSKGQVWFAEMSLVAKYCEQDCKLTYRVYQHYLQILEREELTDFFFNKEVMPLYTNVVFPMQRRGIPLDLKRVKQVRVDLVMDIAVLKNNVQQAIKPNLALFEAWFLNKDYPAKRTGSFAQGVAEMFRLELPRTKSGKYSITPKLIEKLAPSPYKNYLLGGEYLSASDVRQVQLKLWEADRQGNEPMFNLQSKHHLKKLFFDTLHEEPVSRTKKGAPQVDDKFLNLMATKYNWADLLRQYNKLAKLLGTYVDRFLDTQEDGIFYPSFLMHGTTSGRFSGDMQQLPRLKEAGELPPMVLAYSNQIRGLFISGPGYKFVDADYNSLEVVVFADDAGDESLLNMIKKDEDFYSRVAIDIFPELADYSADKRSPMFLKKHKPEVRQAAKVYGLGIRYGMQAFKLSKTINVDTDDAALIIDSYFRKYPKLKIRMDAIIASAKFNGFVDSKGGRRRHYANLKRIHECYGDNILDERWIRKKAQVKVEDGKVVPNSDYVYLKELSGKQKSAINNALNFPIQSMAASIVNAASIALARAFKANNLDAYICLNIHDEICVRCPDGEADQVAKLMKHHLENTLTLDAPLTADPIIGINYGEVK